MNDRNDYKVKGKAWKLVILATELRTNRINCYYAPLGGFIKVEINNGAELIILQNACNELDLKYELF